MASRSTGVPTDKSFFAGWRMGVAGCCAPATKANAITAKTARIPVLLAVRLPKTKEISLIIEKPIKNIYQRNCLRVSYSRGKIHDICAPNTADTLPCLVACRPHPEPLLWPAHAGSARNGLHSSPSSTRQHAGLQPVARQAGQGHRPQPYFSCPRDCGLSLGVGFPLVAARPWLGR